MIEHTRHFTFLLAALLLVFQSANGQNLPSDEDLKSLIDSRIEEGRAVGVVIGVLEADQSVRVVWSGNSGNKSRPLGEESVFEIGSITKVFTGSLLAAMAASGEVSLSDPVSKYLPESVKMPSRAGQEITLLDLATHHSALPPLPSNINPADPANPYADYTVEKMYEFLSEYELTRDIGSAYEYSNFAVGLLGHVLANAAGNSYEETVRERILEPIGMTMTSIRLEGKMLDLMVSGHNEQGEVVPLWDIPTLAGAGAFRSNAGDMLRFLAANIGAPQSQLERTMRENHTARKTVNAETAIGINWHIQSIGDDTIVWHNGGTAGFRTFIGFDSATRVGVVVLANSAHSIDDIGFHLINASVPLSKAPVAVAERTEVEISESILQTYVGEYQLAPQFSIVVTLEEGAMYIQATGQPKIPIFAESETKFFLKVVDAQVSFTKDAAGEVNTMILHQNGANQPGRKL